MNNEIYKDLNLRYIKSQAARFNELENKNAFNKVKNYLLKFFGFLIIIFMFLHYYGVLLVTDNNEIKSMIESSALNVSIKIAIIILLIIIYNILVLKLKNIQIKKIDQNYKKILFKQKIPELSFITQILLFILSPDYYYALKSKNQLITNILEKNEEMNYKTRFFELVKPPYKEISNYQWLKIQIDRKFLVEWGNWNNIALSTVFFYIVCSFYFLEAKLYSNLIYLKISEYLWFTIGCLVAIRIFSRGVEVVIAFYKDVVRVDSKMFYEKNVEDMSTVDKLNNGTYYNGFKFTLLRTQARLSLAIHTLLEFCILFSSIYIILSITITDFWGADVPASPLIAVLHSFSISLFNVSFDASDNMLQNIFHVLQILISGILILLSISQYLNGKDDLKEDTFEYKFYREVFSDKQLKSLSILEAHLGNKTIFYDEKIEVKEINKYHHIYTDKYSKNKITIKFKITFLLKEKLIIEQNNNFKVKVEGKDKIHIQLIENSIAVKK